MTTTAVLSQAPVSGPTNTEIPSETLRVVFREVVDVIHGEDASVAHVAPERFQVGAIRSDLTADRQKWLYVFRATLGLDNALGLASLQYEGRYDEEGGLALVDWSGGAGQWAGVDERPATVPAEHGVLSLAQTGPGLGGRSAYLAFLSHVQLPYHRLDRYFSNDPDVRLGARALLLDPHASAEEGGFGPSIAAAGTSSAPWVRTDPESGHTTAYLIDYVDFARTLHAHYSAAAARFQAYALTNAEKLLHAGLTRSVATAYMQAEGEDRDGVPGRVFNALDDFAEEVEAEQARVEGWGWHLYAWWMRRPAFALAREDATDFGPLEGLTEPQLDAIEAEVARQADLLDGAEQSDHGNAFLADHLARAEAPRWYERVALATRIVTRLAEIPKAFYETLADQAAEEAAEVAASVDALRERRLRAFAQMLTSYEHARVAVPAADGRIQGLQVRILEPMVRGAGRTLALPGSPEFEAVQERLRGRLGLGDHAGDLLRRGVPFRPGTTGPGVEALPVWETLAPGGTSTLTARSADGAGLVLLEPRFWRPGHTYSPGEAPETTFRWRRTEEGLLVMEGGGRRALADLRPVLGSAGSPAARPGADAAADAPARRRGALAQLLDAAGRPASESPAEAWRSLREQVAAQEGALDERALAAELASRRMNWAGRLLGALSVLDLVTSLLEVRAKMASGARGRRRGESAWGAYLEAFGAGAGALSAAAGSVEALRYAVPKAAQGGRLGVALKWAGRFSGGLGAGAGLISFAHEHRTHDEMGMASAAFAIAAGLAVFTPLGPVAIILLALTSVAFHLIANTPSEDWLENSFWSTEEVGEVATLGAAAARRRLTYEVEDLFALLGQPLVSVEVRRRAPGRPSALARYGNAPEPEHPERVRLVIRPGLLPPGAWYEVERLRLLLPPQGWEAARALLPSAEAERKAVPLEAALTVPEPSRDAVVERQEGGAAFVREYDISGLPAAAAAWLRMAPAGLSFAGRVRLRLPGGAGAVEDPAYDIRGSIGYARPRGTMVSMSRAEPAP